MIIIAIVIALLISGAGADSIAAESSTAKIKIINADRQEIGEAAVTETPTGALIRLDLQRNPPKLSLGTHAVHIHEVGECVPPFKSAGAHFNPSQKKHGFLNKQGSHTGDLPNIHVPEGAPLTVEFLIPQVSYSGAKTSLLDADGFALVIHRGTDDYKTDPAGDSGDRVACGAIEGLKQAKQR